MSDARSVMTVDDVRNAVFSKPPIGKRGYNCEEVDSFLDLIEERLQSRNQLSANDVRNVAFGKPPLFRRGYNEDEVDKFLDLVTVTLEVLESRQR